LPEGEAQIRGITMIYRGLVVRYDERKQWGFIQGNSGEEIFFHRANCVSGFQPQLGVDVEYEIGKPFSLGKKDQAVDVRGVQS
jgi:cold shock CspA family protein